MNGAAIAAGQLDFEPSPYDYLAPLAGRGKDLTA